MRIYPRKSVASDQRVFVGRRAVEFSLGHMAKASFDYVFSLETLYMVDQIFYRSRVAFSEKIKIKVMVECDPDTNMLLFLSGNLYL